MTRVKRGSVKKKRRQHTFKLTEGARGAHSRLARTAQMQAIRKLVYASNHRSLRKRNFRSLWITRINATARRYGFSYSTLIAQLRIAQVALNRKMLSQIAILDQESFEALIKVMITYSKERPLAY